jgi:MarR family transcriptional regulator, transcriptional regulator for hemolysin
LKLLTIEERFTASLHNAARCWRQSLDRHLKHMGVGQAGWMAIAVIAKAGEPQSQTELAHKLGVEDPTMMSMIDRLVKAGYVARQPSATDRRVKLAVLTDAGIALYGKVKAEADAFRLAFLADVDKEKLRIATELLEALDAAVESSL